MATRPARRTTVLKWAVTSILVLLVATQVDWGEMRRLLTDLGWTFVVLAVALSLLERVVATVRWHLLLRAGGVRFGFFRLLSLHLAASFLAGFLPTSFSVDAVRIVMVSRRTGKTVECVSASVVDRAVMALGTFGLAGVVLLAVGQALLPPGMARALAIALGLTVTAAAALLVLGKGDRARAVGRSFRPALGEHLSSTLTRIHAALYAFRKQPLALAASALLALVTLFLRIACGLAMAWAVGLNVTFVQLLAVLPLSWVIVMLPVSIGGFGLQEGAYVVMLGLVGVGATAAVTFSLLDHLVVRLAALPGVILWLIEPTVPGRAEAGEAPGRAALLS